MSMRRPYTRKEENEILHYITENEVHYDLRGNAVWKNMVQAGVGQSRTYQSLKEHFRRFIVDRLHKKYFNIDENHIERIRRGYHATAIANRKGSGQTENNEIVRIMSGYRRSYTRSEEMEILKYIIDHEAYYRLRGRAVWREMQEAGVGRERTHESLKEHFKKSMAGRLSQNFYDIDEKKLFLIKQGYMATSVSKGSNNPTPSVSSRSAKQNSSSVTVEVKNETVSDNDSG